MDIITLIIPAFFAGLLMFVAPCTLPLVPAYLAFISGVSAVDIKKDRSVAQKQIRKNSLAFVIGFSLVFIFFGVVAGLFGSFIGPWRGPLTQVGGVCIILFGLFMLNVFSFSPLAKDNKLAVPKSLKPGRPQSAFLIGAIFAIGWTPCIGPILASILLLASTSTTVLEGVLLLSVFSAGLAIPFLLTALLYERASKYIEKYTFLSKSVSLIGGVFLIGVGLLLLSDNFGLTVEYGNQLFYWLGIDVIFGYL